MEKQQLNEMLRKLHEELEQVESVDTTTLSVLATLKEDIQHLLAESTTASPEEQEPISERLGEAIDHFEADHPRLSMAIQHVLDSLAKMGF
jgi:regulator of replication initiation timing